MSAAKYTEQQVAVLVHRLKSRAYSEVRTGDPYGIEDALDDEYEAWLNDREPKRSRIARRQHNVVL